VAGVEILDGGKPERNVKVTICVPGKFQSAYHWARYLERRGELERLITALPYSRGRIFGVSRRRTLSLGGFGAWYMFGERYGPRVVRPLNQLAVNQALGRVAARLLGRVDAFNGWSGVALEGIEAARRRGAISVLQTGSTHIVWQTEVLRGELERFGFVEPLTHPRLVERCEREYEEADAIVVPSQFAEKTFVSQGLPREKLFVIPWAVRPVLTQPPVRTPRADPQILFVGACSLRKGIPYLLKAFRRMETRARLRLVGPINRAVFQVSGGLPERVEAVGPLRGEALAREYRNADIFVLASIEEGSASVISEALAAGLPVVVTDRAGADQVRDGVNGFVVPAGDSLSLAARLDELVADAQKRVRMGRAAAFSISGRTREAYGADLYGRVYRPLLSANSASKTARGKRLDGAV
jgi:starch synthase